MISVMNSQAKTQRNIALSPRGWREFLVPFRLTVLACTLLAMAAASANAQIYDDLDRLRARRPHDFFGRSPYVTIETLRTFLSDAYMGQGFVRDYRERLNKTLLPNRASFVGDAHFTVQLAAAYLWLSQPAQAIELLKPLVESPPPGLDPVVFSDASYNLATAYERTGLYGQALEIAQRMQRLRGGFLLQTEEARLLRLEYKARAHANLDWARRNLSMPEFTRAWREKKLPPLAFLGLEPPMGLDTATRLIMLALLHDPDWPDGWLMLAMILEKRGANVAAYEMYRHAIRLGHPRAAEIRVHERALESQLPAGYSILGTAWQGMQRAALTVVAMFILYYALQWLHRWWRRKGPNVVEHVQKRRARRWRAERWQDHHIDALTRELKDRLEADKHKPPRRP